MLSKSSNFQVIEYLHQHGAIIEKKKQEVRILQISILSVSNTHPNKIRYLSRNKKINFLLMDTAWKHQDMS